jgi:NADPH:quinone reductase-like Zn-dependent oxidoreductase
MKATIPETMTAVRVDPANARIYTETVPVPKPGKGEVLVKMIAAPIHPSDMARVTEIKAEDAVDYIPGLEGVGRVVAAGPGILPKFFNGKRVACFAKHKHSGTWAEYVMTGAGACFPVNKNVADNQAAMTIVNPLTALAFIDLARKYRHRSLINSAASGAVGKLMIHLGSKYGIDVINIVRSDQGVESLKQLGAAMVLNSASTDFKAQLTAMIKLHHTRLMLDAVGGKLVNEVLDLLPTAATVILYGNLSKEPVSFLPTQLVRESREIRGFFLGHWTSDNGMMKTLQNLIRARKMMAQGFQTKIREHVPLKEIQRATEAYGQNMSDGKIILTMGE